MHGVNVRVNYMGPLNKELKVIGFKNPSNGLAFASVVNIITTGMQF